MTKTTVTASAFAEVMEVLDANVAELEQALLASSATDGMFIYCWPEYWLGATLQRAPRAVPVDRAAIVNGTGPLKRIVNGKGLPAQRISRHAALEGALKHARQVRDDLRAQLEVK